VFFATELSLRYVLIDAALRAEDMDGILLHGAPCRSLFRGAGGQQLYTVAPCLADAGADIELAERIKSDNAVERRVTRLHSESGIDDLRRHLCRFLRMNTEGMYVYSRFYDPYVVNCVFPNLTRAQPSEFFAPVDCLITEDARINERRVFYLSADRELRIKYGAISDAENN
jgi:hypothetical protein